MNFNAENYPEVNEWRTEKFAFAVFGKEGCFPRELEEAIERDERGEEIGPGLREGFEKLRRENRKFPELDEVFSIEKEMEAKYSFQWELTEQYLGEICMEEDVLTFTPAEIMEFLADIRRIIDVTPGFRYSIIFTIEGIKEGSGEGCVAVDFDIENRELISEEFTQRTALVPEYRLDEESGELQVTLSCADSVSGI